jgi:hypothetical protein
MDVRTCQGRELSSWGPETSFLRAEGKMSQTWCNALFDLAPPTPANPLQLPPPCDFTTAADYEETACSPYHVSGRRCFECSRLRGLHLETTILAVPPDCSEALMLQVRGVVVRPGPLDQARLEDPELWMLHGHEAQLSKIDALLHAWPPPRPDPATSR